MREMLRRITLVALGGVVMLVAACDEGTEIKNRVESALPDLSDAERELLRQEVEEAESESYGFVFYKSSYQNMNLVGRVGSEPFALVAGSHESNFPFFGDRPWDNGLLLIGDDYYHFNHREQGRALEIDLPLGKGNGDGAVRYDGKMKRVSDGAMVDVTFDLPFSFQRYAPLQLGKPYLFLESLDKELAEKFAGMRWQPFELESDQGTVTTPDRGSEQVEGMHGELEYGVLANLQSPRFAFSYDYVSISEPGADGYSFVDYTANPIDGSGKLGEVLKILMHEFASATVTLDGTLEKSNLNGVDRPSQDDATVTLFENEVDLELAVLKRQMIQTTDADGDKLYGLREIFVPKE